MYTLKIEFDLEDNLGAFDKETRIYITDPYRQNDVILYIQNYKDDKRIRSTLEQF